MKNILNLLSELTTKAEQLGSLNRAVKSLLSHDLASHCQVANVRGDRLILQLDSAVWATQLHYHMADLLQQLQQNKAYANLRVIQYKIRPPIIPPTSINYPKAKPLSPSVRKLLLETAKNLSHEKLADALQRLSKN